MSLDKKHADDFSGIACSSASLSCPQIIQLFVLLLELKVPKRENFSLAFFALSEPIWVCELGTGDKNRIFYRLTPDFDGFWFFFLPHTVYAVNKKKI